MSAADARVTDYDRITDRFEKRYSLYRYDGVRDTLLEFLGPTPLAMLEVGCGTGHWLASLQARLKPSPYEQRPSPDEQQPSPDEQQPSPDEQRPSPDEQQPSPDEQQPSQQERNPPDRSAKASAERPILVGVDPSAPMLARARMAAPAALLVRARAEDLPWRDAAFDRIVCVNALHHFSNRERFFAEALRLLKPGGGLLSVGLDPHTARDQWWVYDFFPETHAIDLARFAPVRLIRGELAKAGFAWAESFEADRVETQVSLREAFPNGVERSFTSQLTVLTDEEFARGVERLRDAGEDVWLAADLRLYATVGWLR